MNHLLNSLSNFVNSAADDNKFNINKSSDEKLNQLSAIPQKKPTIQKSIDRNHVSKYRLVKRKEELILQKSQIQDEKLIWIDIPTIIEE